METRSLISILGPTGIGKTNLSILLAQSFDTEILSCDSRQFYKEMNIGTAVPSEEELLTIKHHFIQNRSIFDDYSVGAFENDAIDLLDDLFKKRSTMIMVGGSGLYVDAVTKGLDDFPKVDPEIREQLKDDLKNLGIEALQKRLAALDPLTYNQIDLQNQQRLIRALEISIGTDHPFSHFRTSKLKKRSFKNIKIGLEAEREIVYKRINQRVDQMIKNGLVEEAKKLYPFRHLNALQTVGYRELFAHFDGTLTLDQAISEIKKNTRRFAKRQGTWFRKDPEIKWFDYTSDTNEIIEFIKDC